MEPYRCWSRLLFLLLERNGRWGRISVLISGHISRKGSCEPPLEAPLNCWRRLTQKASRAPEKMTAQAVPAASGRPHRAWTPSVLGSLISYTVAQLSGALPLLEAWNLCLAPRPLSACFCCWSACSFSELKFALLLFNSFFWPAGLNLIQMPCACFWNLAI